MSKSKQKGTAAETAVVRYLREQGWDKADRLPLKGNLDEGDVSGVDGVAIEVKNQRSYQIPAWLRELDVEIVNSNSDLGVLIVKPNGVGLGSVGKWWAIKELKDEVTLWKQAGR